MSWPYWLLVALLLLLVVCLGIVAHQRDKARMALDLYRSALARVDPAEAQAVAQVAGGRWW